MKAKIIRAINLPIDTSWLVKDRGSGGKKCFYTIESIPDGEVVRVYADKGLKELAGCKFKVIGKKYTSKRKKVVSVCDIDCHSDLISNLKYQNNSELCVIKGDAIDKSKDKIGSIKTLKHPCAMGCTIECKMKHKAIHGASISNCLSTLNSKVNADFNSLKKYMPIIQFGLAKKSPFCSWNK